MKKRFIPLAIADRVLWLANFAAKLPAYVAKYGLTPADATDMANAAAYLGWLIDYLNVAEPSIQKARQFARQLMDGAPDDAPAALPPTAIALPPAPTAVAPDIFGRAAGLAAAIKARPNYNPADGDDLGIEGETVTGKPKAEMQPELRVRAGNGGHPEVVWVKSGMDGIRIYVDRGNGQFVLLAMDTVPNYIDTHALPPAGQSAVWRYRGIYVEDDAEVGQPSDVVSFTVTGGITS